MDKSKNDEVSESQIAVHWKEEDYYEPTQEFKDQANINDAKVFDKFSMENFPQCFSEYADMLDWYKPYIKF